MTNQTTDKLFKRACIRIPGGVNSPVRAFKNMGRPPLFIARGQGAKFYDHDNNAYVDYIGSWGALIHGHAHPKIVEAIRTATAKGTSFGAPTELEVLMSEKLCALMPSLEMVRMVNSGTEATMSAIRLARGYTQRTKIIKFEGCYHGHADGLLAQAGSGMLTLGIPESPGITPASTADTIVLTYNDCKQLEQAFEIYADDLAAVIVEPIAGNMNFIP
ncbi:MAG: aminotransferase class III-fold pyridoxal phosphate-dependent enzyme, partial [Candidatus Oxydemutatoraceae bacterium WSBS_2016_MAG_OTU14]